MAHPSYEVDKTYVAEVDGVVAKATVQQLLDGRHARGRPGRRSARAKVRLEPRRAARIVELVIHEGRNRIVRRLLDQVGHPVRRLTRTAIGPVRLAGLKQGDAARARRATSSARCSTPAGSVAARLDQP